MKNRHVQKAIPLVEEEKGNISLLHSTPAEENYRNFRVRNDALPLIKA